MTKIKEKDDELNNLYTREEIIEIEKKLKISNFQSLDYYDKKKTNLWLSTRGLSLTDNNTLDNIGVQFSKFPN